ncbi:GGDEF domain-containing protein [Parasphingorhabdus sp.]
MIVILGLFSCVFAVIYLRDRKQRMAGWLALAYLSGLAAFLMDISRSFLDPVISDVISKALFWCFSIAVVLGIFDRHKSTYPLMRIGGIVGAGLVPLFWFSFIQNDIILRSVFSSATAGLILFCALPLLWKKRSGALENIMFISIAILCSTYFLRPYLVYGVLDAGHTAANYQSSAFAMLLHASSAFLGLVCGVVMLIVVGYDIIQKLQLAATVDPLTGLMNRRGLDQYIIKELSNERAPDRAVIIIDLDEFKSVNDSYGHETGDEVLKRAASILQRITGELGKVARIGGEEFVVILDEMSSADRLIVAQHLRLSVGMIDHPEMGEKNNVTASFGIAIMADKESFAMALRRADHALYEAKADGRNCVVEASNDNAIRKIRYIERF